VPHLSIDPRGISGQWDFHLGSNGNAVRGVIRAHKGRWKTPYFGKVENTNQGDVC